MNSFASSPRAPGARHPLALAVLLSLAGAAPAWAQAEASLPEVTVSSSGLQLGASEMTQPVSVLEGDELVRRLDHGAHQPLPPRLIHHLLRKRQTGLVCDGLRARVDRHSPQDQTLCVLWQAQPARERGTIT